MGIYLEGIDMPKADKNVAICITIWANGDVTTEFGKQVIGKAISVPPHGRCIDADALDDIGYCCIPKARNDTFDDGVMWLAEQIDSLPTIIPAEEGE